MLSSIRKWSQIGTMLLAVIAPEAATAGRPIPASRQAPFGEQNPTCKQAALQKVYWTQTPMPCHWATPQNHLVLRPCQNTEPALFKASPGKVLSPQHMRPGIEVP